MTNTPQRLQRSRQHKMVNPNGLTIVYVSRPSKWGNPYHIGADGNREQVLKKYREYLAATPSLVEDAKKELRGKNLACWCKPSEDCHADILLEIASKPSEDCHVDILLEIANETHLSSSALNSTILKNSCCSTCS